MALDVADGRAPQLKRPAAGASAAALRHRRARGCAQARAGRAGRREAGGLEGETARGGRARNPPGPPGCARCQPAPGPRSARARAVARLAAANPSQAPHPSAVIMCISQSHLNPNSPAHHRPVHTRRTRVQMGPRGSTRTSARARKSHYVKKKKKVDVHLALKSCSSNRIRTTRGVSVAHLRLAHARKLPYIYSVLFINPMRGHTVRNSTVVFLRSLRFFFPRRPHIKRPKRVRFFFLPVGARSAGV